MKVWGAIFNMIALVVLTMTLTLYLDLSRMCERDIQQIEYQYAVRQASEAMFCDTLTSEDVDMDYADKGYLAINSSNALEIYCRMICYNYNISPSEENFAAIRDSIMGIALCGFDGFYIGETVIDDTIPGNDITKDSYELRFGVKHPYLARSNGNVYSLDTYNESYMFISDDIDTADRVVVSTVYGYPTGITKETVQNNINTQVRDALMEEIEWGKNPNHDEINFRLYFPEITTNSGVNPLKPPCVVTIAKSPDFASEIPIIATATSLFTVVYSIFLILVK